MPYALQPDMILKGKYLVGKVLGQGGFGITYIGRDLQLQRKVAIKEYFPAGFVGRKTGASQVLWYSNEPAKEAMLSGQEVFLKEARKMSKVGNIEPIVQVFDVFQENGTAYICMDFIEGETLQKRLKKTGPLSWEAAKDIFLPLIQCMDQVHRQGLIHRDISPDNLMLQPDGKVKILDLGAAKDLNLNTGKSSMQVAKNGFSPLEQYVQTGSSGSWTDVYAMAATMYYTLTGVVPPSAVDRFNQDLLNWDLPQLLALPPAVCEALKNALAVRFSERTQTMADFYQELQGKIKKNSKSLKKLLSVVAVVAMVAAAAVIGTSISIDTADNTPGGRQEAAVTASDRNLQESISGLMETCTKEIYNYRNGARMELYFNDQDKECLRIFINDEGRDEFIFLAEYDSEGRIQEEYGLESNKLIRHTVWKRNADGNATEILEYKEEGALLEKTEITYDSQGREIARISVDGNGNTTLQANSTYDTEGKETYSGTNDSDEQFVHTYSADGNLLEYTVRDLNGKHKYRMTYQYDKDGKKTEQYDYDENGEVMYFAEYHYKGDLQTGYTHHSYYSDAETVSETTYIFGPRDIQFGSIYTSNNYRSDTEYVRDMTETWNLLNYDYMEGFYSGEVYRVTTYNWDWETIGYEGFDKDGNTVTESENLYDASGKKTGQKTHRYNEDGTYEISVTDADYNAQYREEYSSDDRLQSKTEYLYDSDGEAAGMLQTDYNEDGSYTQTERNASYNLVASWTYDNTGTLLSHMEYRYDSAGKNTETVLTTYYYDGSYTVTVKNADFKTVSENNYDANGKLIK